MLYLGAGKFPNKIGKPLEKKVKLLQSRYKNIDCKGVSMAMHDTMSTF